MDRHDFDLTYKTMLDDVAAIIHNQQVIAGIHSELDKRLLNPLEQDYIDLDYFGQFPAEPISFTHDGVRITTHKLHQTGIHLRDIRGADLLYEIEGEKFILLQYKRAADNRIKNDKAQLGEFLSNCPEICTNKKKRPIPLNWIPLKVFTFCGYWYHIIDDGQIRNVTACEAESIFGGNSSKQVDEFSNGMSQETFFELFASCRIGALVRKPSEIRVKDSWVNQLLEARHFILSILQSDTWKRR